MIKKLGLLLALAAIVICGIYTVKNSGDLFSGFSDVDMIYEQDSGRFYYMRLSENAKKAYTLIVPEIYKHSERIEIPNLSDEEFDSLIYAISYDNPDLVCYGKNCQIITEFTKHYFVPSYTHTLSEHDGVMAALNSAANGIVSAALKGGSQYDAELYIHDSICRRCRYVIDSNDDLRVTAYDALVKGEAVCEGYARAAQLLLTRAGIPNYIVTGEAENSDSQRVGHMWNVVTIDGENYYLDVTWDDADSQQADEDICYFYFNVNEQLLSSDHFSVTPSDNRCVSLDANYYEKLGCLYSDYNPEVLGQIENGISHNVIQRKNYYEMKFTDREAFEKLRGQLLDSDELLELARRVNDRQTVSRFTKVEYIIYENAYYAKIILS